MTSINQEIELNANDAISDHSHNLYPQAPKLKQGFLTVSGLHMLYYATYGNPSGIPVVVLHGGPGAGCQESILQAFNPKQYHIVLFDQRSAMRSTPFGCIEENTTSHLIEDMEKLRTHFGFKQWLVFGGSWGAALAILYGQRFPERCLGFILRGVNLLRKQDSLHLLYGMGKIFPEAYEPVVKLIPPEERCDLLQAYYRRVMDRDLNIALHAAKTFVKYDLICGTYLPNHAKVEQLLKNDRFVMGISKLFLHYAVHHFFIQENQLLSNIKTVADVPAIIIHGRWDAVCLPEMAYLLHKKWTKSSLWFIPQGGHSATDPAILAALATATDKFINI